MCFSTEALPFELSAASASRAQVMMILTTMEAVIGEPML